MKTSKINNIIISLFLIHISFTQIFSNYIVLPFNFKTFENPPFINIKSFYTLLSIGQPQKTIETYIKLRHYNFYLGKGLCDTNPLSNYIPDESETFKSHSDYELVVDQIANATNATDNFNLYANDLNFNENITIKDTQFYLGDSMFENEFEDNETICGIIGLNIQYIFPKYKENNFINILKQKNVISSNTFSFIFSNSYNKNNIFGKNYKYDNFLIIGMNETDVSKVFNSNDLRTMNIEKNYDWRISIDEIFLNYNKNLMSSSTNNKFMSVNSMANFDNDFDFIMIKTADFNFINDIYFKEYIEKNICRLKADYMYNYNFNYIICKTDFKSEMKKFPNINFMVKEINYTFTLTYEDLFIELNNYIYFMIVKEDFHSYYSTFGNVFLKKFPLVFDYEKKTITFININNTIINDKNSGFGIDYVLFIICGICIIVGISFGFIIGKVWKKNKKKNADELIDDCEYNINEDNNEQNKNESSNEINN